MKKPFKNYLSLDDLSLFLNNVTRAEKSVVICIKIMSYR